MTDLDIENLKAKAKFADEKLFAMSVDPRDILALIDRVEKAEEQNDEIRSSWVKSSFEISRLRALLARAGEALGPFHLLAPGEARGWADESGWTDRAPKNERICDWFGPTDFRDVVTVANEIEEVIGHD